MSEPAGHGFPAAGLGRAAAGWLDELDLPAVSREIITDCLAFIDILAGTILRLVAGVRARAKADPRVKTLTTLPGVGHFTVLVSLAEIGGIARFGSEAPGAQTRVRPPGSWPSRDRTPQRR